MTARGGGGGGGGKEDTVTQELFDAHASDPFAHHTPPAPGGGNLLGETTTLNTWLGVGALGRHQEVSNGAVENVAVGRMAGWGVLSGDHNVAVGHEALAGQFTGNPSHNVAIGYKSHALSVGNGNVAVGSLALSKNTRDGNDNVAIGFAALENAGDDPSVAGLAVSNIAIGHQAGRSLFRSYGNIYIGNVGPAVETATISSEDNTIRIGQDIGVQFDYRTFIHGIWNATPVPGVAVTVDADGQLTTMASSRLFKKEIAPMPSMTDRLMRLRPVQFRYKAQDASLEFGLIAEEVAEVEPALVNPEGDHVYYRKVNAMLPQGRARADRSR